jgi:hypothetical protein
MMKQRRCTTQQHAFSRAKATTRRRLPLAHVRINAANGRLVNVPR